MKLQKRKAVYKIYSVRLPAAVRDRLTRLRDEGEYDVSSWVRNLICTSLENLSLSASLPEISSWTPEPDAAAFADLNAPRDSEQWRWIYEGYLADRRR